VLKADRVNRTVLDSIRKFWFGIDLAILDE
jgi:hypothetical protein